jgi:hypothetical protein
MATIKFTEADVKRLLRLRNAQDVEDLITCRALEISGYTRRGRPLFDGDSIRRAAERVIREEAPPA